MKKILIFVLSAVLAVSLSLPLALAAGYSPDISANETAIRGEADEPGETPDSECPLCPDGSECPGVPGDSGKEEPCKIKPNDYFFMLQSKFELLNDSQKKEVYKLNDKLLAHSKKMIDKYVEFGLFTELQGTTLCRMLEDGCKQAKNEGKLMLGLLPPVPAA